MDSNESSSESASCGLGPKAGGETGNINDGALVSALAYLLFLIERFYLEMYTSVFDACHLAAKCDTHADRRGGQVPHIYACAHRIIAFVEERLHRIAGSHFEVADHVGRAQHPSSFDAQKSDGIFVVDDDGGFVSCTNGYVDHRDIIGRGRKWSRHPWPV